MRRLLCCFLCLLLLVSLTGCSFLNPFSSRSKRAAITGIPAYQGLKAKITVVDFDIKSAKANSDIAAGLKDMLVSVLASSNRFLVVKPQSPGVDLVISVAVTGFDPEASGGRFGIGGGGSVGSGLYGGLVSGGMNKAYMALDIRVVDAVTTEVLSTKTVQAQALDTSGNIMSGASGIPGLNSKLSEYSRTPMEKAIRLGIIEAERYIIEATPEKYYKHKN